MRRCPRCAHPLAFAGVDSLGASVYACASTVYHDMRTARGPQLVASPCAAPGELFLANGQPAPKGTDPRAKRDKKGNVIIFGLLDHEDVLPLDPALPFVREMAAKYRALDNLPHAIDEKDPRIGKPVPTYIRLKARKLIEAWAAKVNGGSRLPRRWPASRVAA